MPSFCPAESRLFIGQLYISPSLCWESNSIFSSSRQGSLVSGKRHLNSICNTLQSLLHYLGPSWDTIQYLWSGLRDFWSVEEANDNNEEKMAATIISKQTNRLWRNNWGRQGHSRLRGYPADSPIVQNVVSKCLENLLKIQSVRDKMLQKNLSQTMDRREEWATQHWMSIRAIYVCTRKTKKRSQTYQFPLLSPLFLP